MTLGSLSPLLGGLGPIVAGLLFAPFAHSVDGTWQIPQP